MPNTSQAQKYHCKRLETEKKTPKEERPKCSKMLYKTRAHKYAKNGCPNPAGHLAFVLCQYKHWAWA